MEQLPKNFKSYKNWKLAFCLIFFLFIYFPISYIFQESKPQFLLKVYNLQSEDETTTKSIETFTTVHAPVKNFKTLNNSFAWLIKKSYNAYKCVEIARRLTNWNIMCIAETAYPNENYENLIKIQKTDIIDARLQFNLDTFSSPIIFFAMAIKMQAKIIYLHNDELSENMVHRLKHMNTQSSVHYIGTKDSFNASLYYGCSTETNPDLIKNHTRFNLCQKIEFSGLSTPVSLVNTGQDSLCDSNMPDIVMPQNHLVPITFYTSIYGTCSFLYIPFIDFDELEAKEKIKYNCLVQHLMWRTGCSVSVHWSEKKISTFNVSHESCEEIVEIIDRCETYENNTCFIDVINQVFDDQTVIKLSKWIQFLKNVTFKQSISNKLNLKCSEAMWHPKPNKVYENFEIIQKSHETLCTNYTKANNSKPDFVAPWYQRPNIVLMVVFNNLFVDVIPLIEIQYRPFYPNIVYCVDRVPEDEKLTSYKLNFVTYKQKGNPGGMHYECYLKVIMMNLDIDGIFAIADDNFVKTDVLDFSSDKIWFRSEKKYFIKDLDLMKDCHKNGVCNFSTNWIWWAIYKKNIMNFFEEIDLQTDPDIIKMRKQLKVVTKGKHRLFGCSSDSLYMPERFFSNFSKIIHLLRKNDVFLEIAIPTAVRSIEHVENIQEYSIYSDWTVNRNSPWKFMKRKRLEGVVLVHPVKLSSVYKGNPEALNFFCGCLVPYLHDTNRIYPC